MMVFIHRDYPYSAPTSWEGRALHSFPGGRVEVVGHFTADLLTGQGFNFKFSLLISICILVSKPSRMDCCNTKYKSAT